MTKNPARIAYFTSVYPRASDSFIRGEVDALRRQGIEVQTFALRAPENQQLVSEELRKEAATTQYILNMGWPHLILHFLLHSIFQH